MSSEMKMKKGYVPELRFPEFNNTSEWKHCGFYELLDEIIDFRGRTPAKLGMTWGGGNIISLSANNVKNGYIDYAAECNLGSQELYEKWMGKVKLERNDIVFTMEAPLGNALLIPDSQKYILSQRVVAFKTKKNINNDFLIQLIWDSRFQYSIDRLSSGSTAKGINQGSLRKIYVTIPIKEEQQKIADCFSSLDNVISLQTQKIDELQQYKKGLMQKLFPAEGEMVPKLRFAEFQNNAIWEEKNIGSMCKTFSGGTPLSKNKEYYGGDIPFIRSGEINEYKTDLYLTKSGLERSSAKLVEKGDVLIALYGANSGDVALAKINGAINQAILCLKSTQSHEFIYHYLSHKKDYFVGLYLQGGQGNLSGEIIKSIKLCFPTREEQQKIANCLSSLDERIAAETQKLTTLKNHKTGLMQQLFPAMDEVKA